MSAGTITAAGGGSGASGASGVRTLLFGTWRGRFGIAVLALTIFVAIFGDVITLLGITIVLFVFDWRLAIVTLVILPGMLAVTAWFRRGAREGFRKVRTRIAKINAFLQEHVSGMSVVQLFGREKVEYERFEKINDEHRVANIETIFYYAVFFPAIEIISSSRSSRSRISFWRRLSCWLR